VVFANNNNKQEKKEAKDHLPPASKPATNLPGKQ